MCRIKVSYSLPSAEPTRRGTKNIIINKAKETVLETVHVALVPFVIYLGGFIIIMLGGRWL